LLGLRPHLLEPPPVTVLIGALKPLAKQREWLGWHVAQTWLGHAGLVPGIAWRDESTATVTLRLSDPDALPFSPWPVNTTFSVLAMQLAALLTSHAKYPRCTDCGTPFETKRSASRRRVSRPGESRAARLRTDGKPATGTGASVPRSAHPDRGVDHYFDHNPDGPGWTMVDTST
ncbi:MAG: hypothetical protein ACR2OO_10380, partial [Thermomicrobiales bacterium]